MKRLIFSTMIAGALALTAPVTVGAAQKAPKGATAQCKDGTYSSAKSKRGACSNHGGIATWLADAATPTKDAGDAKETKAASKDASRPSSEPVEKPGKSVAKAPGKAGDPTAQCNDGTYSYAAHHQGACSGHQGVKTWFK